MYHTGCGGGKIVEEYGPRAYHFTGDDAEQFGAVVPAYICSRCGVEILGDAQVDLCICDTEPAAPCPVHGATYKGVQPEDILHKEY